MSSEWTREKLEECCKGRRINQICVCTDRDIEEYLDEWIEKLHIGPWKIIEMTNETIQNFGWGNEEITEPFKYLCCLAQCGNMEFEIMKKEYGPYMADEFMKKKGEGLQHIKEVFTDEDFPKAVEYYEAAGFKKCFYGQVGDNKWCAFESEEPLGFMIEIGNDLAPDMSKVKMRIYPEE